jgi:predicted XRE-type DNA-binding protein
MGFWDKVTKNDSCRIWNGCCLKRPNNSISYGQLRISHRRRIYSHRMAWELINGPIPEGMEVCHTCDNPVCVNPEHLFLGNHLENMRDAKEKGRMRALSGEDCKFHKLTIDQVREIKKSTLSQRKLANLYGVTQGAISHILVGKNWKGVEA